MWKSQFKKQNKKTSWCVHYSSMYNVYHLWQEWPSTFCGNVYHLWQECPSTFYGNVYHLWQECPSTFSWNFYHLCDLNASLYIRRNILPSLGPEFLPLPLSTIYQVVDVLFPEYQFPSPPRQYSHLSPLSCHTFISIFLNFNLSPLRLVPLNPCCLVARMSPLLPAIQIEVSPRLKRGGGEAGRYIKTLPRPFPPTH